MIVVVVMAKEGRRKRNRKIKQTIKDPELSLTSSQQDLFPVRFSHAITGQSVPTLNKLFSMLTSRENGAPSNSFCDARTTSIPKLTNVLQAMKITSQIIKNTDAKILLKILEIKHILIW